MDRKNIVRSTLILVIVQDAYAHIGNGNIPATAKSKARAAHATAEQANASVVNGAESPVTRVALVDETIAMGEALVATLNQLGFQPQITFTQADRAFAYGKIEQLRAFCQEYGIDQGGNNPFARTIRQLHILLAFAGEGNKKVWQQILAQAVTQLLIDVRTAYSMQAFADNNVDSFYYPEFDTTLEVASSKSWTAPTAEVSTGTQAPANAQGRRTLVGAGNQG